MLPSPSNQADRENGVNPADCWYVPDRRIRTACAARKARYLADQLICEEWPQAAPDEGALVMAMHTCAYQALRNRGGTGRKNAGARKWARRWRVIRDYLVDQNIGLVFAMQQRYAVGPAYFDRDDLLSEGMFGLLRAVERFNPWRGFKFSTYACHAIGRAMIRQRQYESRYHERFTVQHDVALDQAAEGGDFATELYLERLKRALRENTSDLSAWESAILAQRFPPSTCQRRTLKEIGRSYGVSKERVRQLEQQALSKIRTALFDDVMLQ
ncbi:MAG: sigma-70 family RNA polymerase sigma factor [Phycisphaerales bacterium]|mgnify:CR=1 FL=1|nr:sigma-70 family RNA polymerase sigma factor [Phycisphaerales bacterium]